jgi:hypothetical protein
MLALMIGILSSGIATYAYLDKEFQAAEVSSPGLACPSLPSTRAARLAIRTNLPRLAFARPRRWVIGLHQRHSRALPQEVLIEGWFPHFAREQGGFRVDGTTDIVTPMPRSPCQRNCGSRHTPLNGDRRIDHLFLTTSIYSRTRVDAGCQNDRIVRRWMKVCLDIHFHRSPNKRHFAFTESHPQNVR